MTVQDALKAALREVVAPNARAHGFKGSAPNFRRSTPAGDWAVVNVQSSLYGTSESQKCVINLGVAPEPWLRWERAERGDRIPKAVPHFLCLYESRVHRSGAAGGSDGWWPVTESTALAAAHDMVAQLEEHAWPLLDRLQSPGGFLAAVRARDPELCGWHMREDPSTVVALLTMDDGPSGELDACLRDRIERAKPEYRDDALRFAGWVRAQASQAG